MHLGNGANPVSGVNVMIINFNAMIFKILSPRLVAKHLAFMTQKIYVVYILFIAKIGSLVFIKKPIFSPKLCENLQK
jgi:hypothetical protein